MDFNYSLLEIFVVNLGMRQSCQGCQYSKKLDSQHFRKLNVRECWRINYLIILSQSKVLGVPRLLHPYLLPILALLCAFLRNLLVVAIDKYFFATRVMTQDKNISLLKAC